MKFSMSRPVYQFYTHTIPQVSPHPAHDGDCVTISATVKAMDGIDGTIADRPTGTVSVTVSNTKQNFPLTEGQHTVTITTPPLKAKDYRVKVEYSGDDFFTASDATFTLRVFRK